MSTPQQSGSSAPTRRPLPTAAQIRAIFGAMRTFRDDDRSRAAHDATVDCDRCGRTRPAAGALAYGRLRLCNGCATDYELLRMAGMEPDLTAPAEPSPTSGV